MAEEKNEGNECNTYIELLTQLFKEDDTKKLFEALSNIPASDPEQPELEQNTILRYEETHGNQGGGGLLEIIPEEDEEEVPEAEVPKLS